MTDIVETPLHVLKLLQQNLLTPDTKGILAGLGLAIASYSTFSVLSALSIYFLPSKISTYHHGSSPYALITGASDGIGLALASEFSSRGFNIILHGRNASKLRAVALHLSSKHPQRHYEVLVADAATFPPTAEAYTELLEPVKHLNITILVNNVGNVGGVTNRSIRTVADWSDSETEALMNLNVMFTLHLTRAMLPHLQLHEPACIVNCGSVAAAGIPYLAHYSGMKAFLKSWSRALSIELKVGERRDIEVLHAEIGEVGTPSNPGGANTGLKVDAATFAKAWVDRMG
jgi:17beta-estradiol 17-dehydrogenase / very-long-chain 3-oxoacyl-CoA reductase